MKAMHGCKSAQRLNNDADQRISQSKILLHLMLKAKLHLVVPIEHKVRVPEKRPPV